MLFEKLGFVGVAVVGASLFFSVSARADEAAAAPPADAAASPPAADAPAAAAPKTDAKPAPKGEVDDDGVRFRGGISGGAGALIFTDAGAAAGLGDIDGRLGVQINDLIGIYVQPQIALGADSTFFAGSLGTSLLVDFTFIDQIFVGVGGGGGLVQYGSTVGAGELHFRAGGYPLMGYGEDNVRRKGLMLSADVRLHFASGSVLVSPIASIGYEAF